jgi:amidophosphoribosyltransferase
MCGICGVLHVKSCEQIVENELSESLKHLRHRGYDGCGLSINLPYKETLVRRRIMNTSRFIKNLPLPLIERNIENKDCNCDNREKYRISGIAHTRYKTAGECKLKNTQPVLNKSKDIALVHNGQVEVYSSSLDENSSQSIEQMFDSKYILEVFESAFKKTKSIFQSVKTVHDTVKGSYACIIMIKDLGIVGFRDPRGIRPLVFGTDINNNDEDLFENVKTVNTAIFASESSVIDGLGYKLIRDVAPGESIFVDLKGNVRYGNYGNSKIPSGKTSYRNYTPCLFEYIYLADETSVIDGIQVGRAREIMGELLFEKLNRYFGSIDVMAPIPNTPVNATKKLAEMLGVKYVDLLYLPSMKELEKDIMVGANTRKNIIKNSRTFILPTQNKRELAVKEKFRINVDHILDCQDKVLALVDDSIVRGTTMSIVVKMIIELAQPKKVILVSLAPPIKYENVYGIDIPDRHTLIAHDKSLKDITIQLGVDEIIYGNLDSIVRSFKREAASNGVYVDGYESSVFRQ